MVIVAASALSVGAALLEACRSLGGQPTPDEGSPKPESPAPVTVSAVPINAGDASVQAETGSDEDAAQDSGAPDGVQDAKQVGSWHQKDAAADARRGHPNQSTVIYE